MAKIIIKPQVKGVSEFKGTEESREKFSEQKSKHASCASYVKMTLKRV